MDPYHSGFLVLLAFILVFVNAFFVVSEFAIVKVRRSKLEELAKNGVKNVSLALKITSSLDTYLSATQLGITLASLALGWVSQDGIGKLITYFFAFAFDGENAIIHIISITISFVFITLLHVVLGELVPKSIAIAKTESMVLFIAKPLHYFWIAFYPFIHLFDLLALFFLKRLGITQAKEGELAHSEEELKIIVGESLKGGYIDSIEGEIIKNAVDFSDILAKEIMTPRKDMVCLNAKDSYEENLKIVLETNHTRYPYYTDSKDNILGMIHIRDLLESLVEKKERDMLSLVRKMIIVPESAHISEILTTMKRQQIHTALVVDEFGGTSGLLTMEDIIEEVMGDISDEHDLKVSEYKQLSENTYEVSGKLDIESFEEMLGVQIDETNDHLTIGGYIFGLLGRLPEVGDTCSAHSCEFEVIEMDNTRIQKLKVTKNPLPQSE
ncbi:hemolysin family protein [Helicobacter himalayensis]|uniref:hemolysin family protein n=1 Tax=Helicobacter himalayensis TaxID=1591088 RepID=UPI00082BB75C|nr:hemolysin family protein [Helicobacter himalayensis]